MERPRADAVAVAVWHGEGCGAAARCRYSAPPAVASRLAAG
ncbi:MAG: hypothetical protein PUH57_02730 [Prevotellaceae bacterium]|nr:hypothetical protein [Prevotellaceae bacterium]MDY2749841.1 hypothetical protein [Prevotella sp.]